MNRENGLSLCVQGTRGLLNYQIYPIRFIPMCIGNTRRKAVFLHLKSVYPYVYREHFALESTAENINGLSLCVQGTLTSIRSLIFCNRFIPMCIGNTLPKQTHQLLAPVYPYVYREHGEMAIGPLGSSGLSLCVQGTRLPFLPFFFTSTVYPYVYREHGLR